MSRGRARSRAGRRAVKYEAVAAAWLMMGCAAPVERGDPAALSATDPEARERQALERARAKRAAWVEPVDLEDARRRLQAVREKLAATGIVEMRYTEAELRALVKFTPAPQERYLVRVLPREPKDGDRLGFPREFGKLPVWVATFEQLEPADTDPEVLCRVLGLTFDPKVTYTVLVLRDLGADLERRPEMFIPTREKILELAKRELVNPYFGADDFDRAMAEPYQATFRAHMDELYRRGLRDYIPDDVDLFVASVPALRDDPVQQRLFRTRLRVLVQFGATQLFRGDGLTLMEGEQARKVGVAEIFLLDPDPKPIGVYAEKQQLLKVPCEPLTKPRPLTFTELGEHAGG